MPLVQAASRDGFIADMCGLRRDCHESLARKWMDRRLCPDEQAWSLVIVAHEHGAVGEIGFHADQDCVSGQIYYWVLSTERRHGWASRAVRLVCGWALGGGPVRVMTAIVSDRNVASGRVLVNAGFKRAWKVPKYAGFRDCSDTIGYVLT